MKAQRIYHPADIGPEFLRADGYQRGSFEMAMNVCREAGRTGVAIDLGAHIGTWTMRLVRCFKEVVAIEADESRIRFLRLNAPEAHIINAFVNGERTLDELHSRRVDFIKIDTDSPLKPIVEGAAWMLYEHRPIVCAELVHNDVFDEEGFMAMVKLGYVDRAHYNKDFVFIHKEQETVGAPVVRIFTKEVDDKVCA